MAHGVHLRFVENSEVPHLLRHYKFSSHDGVPSRAQMGEKGSAGQISTDRYPGQRATKPRAGSELVHTRVKRALFSGCIDSVLYSIRQLAKGRRAKDVLSHKNYFDHNRHRMQYSTFKRQGLPRGRDYVSHCTSSVGFGTSRENRRRGERFLPCILSGKLSPGCSYRHSFFSL